MTDHPPDHPSEATDSSTRSWTDLAKDVAHRTALAAEGVQERIRRRLDDGSPPDHLRIMAYLGHGNPGEVVVRGRVVDDPEPSEAVHGEGTLAAMKRMAKRFETDEVPGVHLEISLGDGRRLVTTDEEGYFDVRLEPGLDPGGTEWHEVTIDLASPYRGIEPGTGPHLPTTGRVRVPSRDIDLLVISDIDDTILQTGAQRLWDMIRVTATNSALTRTAFPGVPELYRALEAGTGGPARPFFYVSSSPWNLEGFLRGFITHRDIPLGPLLLRDLGIDQSKFVKAGHGEHKLTRIAEVLQLHTDVPVLLIGDSGQHDPQIYEQVVQAHPGRVAAVWIREVRLDPGDGRVEAVAGGFTQADVPMVLAAESGVFADHAVELGLIPGQAAAAVHTAVAEALADPTGAEEQDPGEHPDD